MGFINCSALSEVGKEFGHTRTTKMMSARYLKVGFGNRRHHSGTLDELGTEFGLTRTDDDVQQKRST